MLGLVESKLQLGVLIGVVRAKMVNWGFVGYVAVTKWYMGFMDDKE